MAEVLSQPQMEDRPPQTGRRFPVRLLLWVVGGAVLGALWGFLAHGSDSEGLRLTLTLALVFAGFGLFMGTLGSCRT